MRLELRESGLHRTHDELTATAIAECRLRILDSVIGLTAGGLTGAGVGLGELGSPPISRARTFLPMYPTGQETDLESAAFVNAALLRQTDWMDSYRRGGTVQMGHPADQMAAVFALCNYPEMTGHRLVELTHLCYQLFRAWSDAMPNSSADGWDTVSKLSLCVPLIAGTFFQVDDDRMNNALALSACNGAVLGGVRRGQISNWKTGLSGYAVARALWCYRLSAHYGLGDEILGAGPGNWSETVSAVVADVAGVEPDEVFQYMMLKEFPCYQYGQAAISCASKLHKELGGQIDHVQAIEIGMPARDYAQVKSLLHGERPLAPSSADHNVTYAVATALEHGYVGPGHYAREHLDDISVERLMDVTTVESLTADSPDAARVVLRLPDRQLAQSLSVAQMTASELTPAQRVDLRREVVLRKADMLSSFSGIDLSSVVAATAKVEAIDGAELIRLVHEAVGSASAA